MLRRYLGFVVWRVQHIPIERRRVFRDELQTMRWRFERRVFGSKVQRPRVFHLSSSVVEPESAFACPVVVVVAEAMLFCWRCGLWRENWQTTFSPVQQ